MTEQATEHDATGDISRKRTVLKYVELKSGFGANGPAWIDLVTPTKSGRGFRFQDKLLLRATGGGIAGNYFDEATGEEYWVSGPKKNGEDRHYTGRGPVTVTDAAKTAYEAFLRTP